LSFDDRQEAIIGVRNLTVFRAIQRTTSQIQAAFKDAGQFVSSEAQKNIKIELKITNTNTPISTTPDP
jgi:uracil phosphoribosyltransferase